MTGEAQLLKDVTHISPVLIDPPNGATTVATKQGTIALDNLILKNTLLVPSLSCNLVSVSRVCKDLDCTVTFNDNSCIL